MSTLNSRKFENNGLEALMKAAREAGDGVLPVEKWHPEYCGEMDMIIRKDGSWWHEGTRLTRQSLVKLFASVLRKDADEQTYLVTPVEKIKIEVECAPFLAVRADIQGEGEDQTVFFTTNVGDVIAVGPENPIKVETDENTLEPTPFVRVRGRLDALITRAVFYELVEVAIVKNKRLGVYADGEFFPLGPKGILDA